MTHTENELQTDRLFYVRSKCRSSGSILRGGSRFTNNRMEMAEKSVSSDLANNCVVEERERKKKSHYKRGTKKHRWEKKALKCLSTDRNMILGAFQIVNKKRHGYSVL